MTSLKDPDQLGDKALANVTALLSPVAGEQLLLVYDATTFGAASRGLAITDQRIASYDHDGANFVDYPNIAAIRIETADNPLTHHVKITTKQSGTPIETVVYLAADDLSRLIAAIRPRVPDGALVVRRGPTEVGRFAVADRPVRCGHCGGEELAPRQILLDTQGLALVHLDWLARSAHGLECTSCGHLALFTRAPRPR